MRARILTKLAWVALVSAIASMPAGSALAESTPPPGDFARDTLTTLAGPGYCPGDAVRDPVSSTVRALAVGAGGELFFDTGRSGAAARRLGIVPAGGQPTLVTTGIGVGIDPPDLKDLTQDGAPAAGRLAPDGRGGVIVAGGATLIQLDRSNGVTVVAGGSPAAGGGGDGGPAAAARLAGARSVTTDATGSIYVADAVDVSTATVRIRFVNRTGSAVVVYPGTPWQRTVAPGAIETIAGSSGGGAAGDRGPALGATIRGVPPSLAVVGDRLYIATYVPGRGAAPADARVRMVNLGAVPISAHGVVIAPGYVDTVALGSPHSQFSYLPGISADAHGNLYLADEFHQRIRRVGPDGTTATVAGSGGDGAEDGGFNGNNRPATEARLNRPYDVKVGPASRLYIADQRNDQIRYIDAGGIIRAAPGGELGLTWHCMPVTPGALPSPLDQQLQTGGPASVATDSAGTVYVANIAGNQVKAIGLDGVIRAVAGSGVRAAGCGSGLGCAGSVGDGGPATAALLDGPSAVASTSTGDLYILDNGNARIRFVNRGSEAITVHGVRVPAGAIETVVGTGQSGAGGDGGLARRAQIGRLVTPTASALEGFAVGFALSPFNLESLALDSRGDLLFADHANDRVRQVDPSGTITTVAGDGAADAQARCCPNPMGLAVDATDNLYISGGAGLEGMMFDSGNLADVRATNPGFSARPQVWFLNRGRRAVQAVGQTVPAGAARPVVGKGISGLAEDGMRAVDAPLLGITSLATDRRGNLYMAEIGHAGSGTIGDVLRVDPAGVIRIAAGSGTFGFNGDGLPGRATNLSAPTGIALDACGNLLIAEVAGDRIRRLDLAGPCAQLVAPGRTAPTSAVHGPMAALVVVALLGVAAVALGWRRRPGP